MTTVADNGRILPALSISDINTTINGEPRVLDLRLAEALGFKRPADIRPLIERHREAIERLGGIFRTVRKNTGRGRPANEFWLTKKQAVYLTTKSETDIAVEATIQVVEVFDAATSGQPVQPMLALPPPETKLCGMSPSQILHPDIIARVEARARRLAEDSIPRLRDELLRDLTIRLAADRPIDIEDSVFRVSTLRRYKPGSEEEARYLIDQWAWEINPDTKDLATRAALKAAITDALRGAKALPNVRAA